MARTYGKAKLRPRQVEQDRRIVDCMYSPERQLSRELPAEREYGTEDTSGMQDLPLDPAASKAPRVTRRTAAQKKASGHQTPGITTQRALARAGSPSVVPQLRTATKARNACGKKDIATQDSITHSHTRMNKRPKLDNPGMATEDSKALSSSRSPTDDWLMYEDDNPPFSLSDNPSAPTESVLATSSANSGLSPPTASNREPSLDGGLSATQLPPHLLATPVRQLAAPTIDARNVVTPLGKKPESPASSRPSPPACPFATGPSDPGGQPQSLVRAPAPSASFPFTKLPILVQEIVFGTFVKDALPAGATLRLCRKHRFPTKRKDKYGQIIYRVRYLPDQLAIAGICKGNCAAENLRERALRMTGQLATYTNDLELNVPAPDELPFFEHVSALARPFGDLRLQNLCPSYLAQLQLNCFDFYNATANSLVKWTSLFCRHGLFYRGVTLEAERFAPLRARIAQVMDGCFTLEEEDENLYRQALGKSYLSLSFQFEDDLNNDTYIHDDAGKLLSGLASLGERLGSMDVDADDYDDVQRYVKLWLCDGLGHPRNSAYDGQPSLRTRPFADELDPDLKKMRLNNALLA